jgi:hypothetical protein
MVLSLVSRGTKSVWVWVWDPLDQVQEKMANKAATTPTSPTRDHSSLSLREVCLAEQFSLCITWRIWNAFKHFWLFLGVPNGVSATVWSLLFVHLHVISSGVRWVLLISYFTCICGFQEARSASCNYWLSNTRNRSTQPRISGWCIFPAESCRLWCVTGTFETVEKRRYSHIFEWTWVILQKNIESQAKSTRMQNRYSNSAWCKCCIYTFAWYSQKKETDRIEKMCNALAARQECPPWLVMRMFQVLACTLETFVTCFRTNSRCLYRYALIKRCKYEVLFPAYGRAWRDLKNNKLVLVCVWVQWYLEQKKFR